MHTLRCPGEDINKMVDYGDNNVDRVRKNRKRCCVRSLMDCEPSDTTDGEFMPRPDPVSGQPNAIKKRNKIRKLNNNNS